MLNIDALAESSYEIVYYMLNGYIMLLGCLLIVLLNLHSSVATKSTCPEKWEKVGHFCYRVDPEKTHRYTFDEAENMCRVLHPFGRLPRLDNSGVAKKFKNYWNAKVRTQYLINLSNRRAPKHFTWLGLSDRDEEGVWKWISSLHTPVERAEYFEWKNNQPDNRNNIEHCVTFADAWSGTIHSDKRWNDLRCNDVASRIVCQMDPLLDGLTVSHKKYRVFQYNPDSDKDLLSSAMYNISRSKSICSGSSLDLTQAGDTVIKLQKGKGSHKISKLMMPVNGEIIFDDTGTLVFTNKPPSVKESYYCDARNKNQVPFITTECTYAAVWQFIVKKDGTDSRYVCRIIEMGVDSIRKHSPISSRRFQKLQETVEGRRFYEPCRDDIQFHSENPSKIQITEQYCQENTCQNDYLDQNSQQMTKICKYVNCKKELPCVDSFRPKGHCCQICGARILFTATEEFAGHDLHDVLERKLHSNKNFGAKYGISLLRIDPTMYQIVVAVDGGHSFKYHQIRSIMENVKEHLVGFESVTQNSFASEISNDMFKPKPAFFVGIATAILVLVGILCSVGYLYYQGHITRPKSWSHLSAKVGYSKQIDALEDDENVRMEIQNNEPKRKASQLGENIVAFVNPGFEPEDESKTTVIVHSPRDENEVVEEIGHPTIEPADDDGLALIDID